MHTRFGFPSSAHQYNRNTHWCADDGKPKRVRINTELNYIAGHYDISVNMNSKHIKLVSSNFKIGLLYKIGIYMTQK